MRPRGREDEDRLGRGSEDTYNDTNQTSTVKSMNYSGGRHDPNYIDEENDEDQEDLS